MFKLSIDNGDLGNSQILSDKDFLQDPDFLCCVGSRLYGTATEDSDLDIRGFTFLPPEYVLGVKRFQLHENLQDGEDIVVWSVDKFVRMLLKGSTIAFEMLSCPEAMTIRKSDLAAELLRHRAKFVSKKVVKSILGYAQNEWRKALGEATRDLGEKRKAHIREKGYSYKNAYHALRILVEGLELANTGFIEFPVNTAGFLVEVKTGNVPFADVAGLYEGRLARLEGALDSSLREAPDTEFINKLLCQLNLRSIMRELIPEKTCRPLFFQDIASIP